MSFPIAAGRVVRGLLSTFGDGGYCQILLSHGKGVRVVFRDAFPPFIQHGILKPDLT